MCLNASLPSDFYGVDTVAVKNLGAAFSEGSLGPFAPAAAFQPAAWGDSLLNCALVSVAILLCLVASPSFAELFRLLTGSLTRLKPAMDLENNVRLSRERNRLAALALLVVSLVAARFGLVSFGFAERLGPWAATLSVIGACTLAMLLKMGLSQALAPRRTNLEYYHAADSLFLNILIMTATLLVVTIGIFSLFRMNVLVLRNILLYELGAAFLLNCIRRLDLSLHSCNLFTAFLYLCALDFFPAALLVSATLFI